MNTLHNLYSANEAMDRLGVTQGQFQNLVRQGKIKRIIPPGRTRGMYKKRGGRIGFSNGHLYIKFLGYRGSPNNTERP